MSHQEERYRGYVVNFARGYGFICAGTSAEDEKAPRYFFHHSSIEGNSNGIADGKMVTFALGKGRDGRPNAIAVRDASGNEVAFKRTANVNMNVSSQGRRVGVVAPNPSATFCFAIDQTNGEKVFVPLPLSRGQQIEYTLEMSEKGPKATEVTGPMGAKLDRAVAGKGPAKQEAKPQARPQPKRPQMRVVSKEDEYDDVDYKYM